MLIKYKCRCMKDEREIIVTDRVPGSGIGSWMRVVQDAVSYDHQSRNALCNAGKAEYIKIPHQDPDTEVGTKPVVN